MTILSRVRLKIMHLLIEYVEYVNKREIKSYAYQISYDLYKLLMEISSGITIYNFKHACNVNVVW